jgi:hypothetical protein
MKNVATTMVAGGVVAAETGMLSVSATATASGVQVTATVLGASTAAVSLSTVILATGGAAALLLVGYGVYRACSEDT